VVRELVGVIVGAAVVEGVAMADRVFEMEGGRVREFVAVNVGVKDCEGARVGERVGSAVWV